ncbi:MAG: peroxide stress protein YaaA [Bacteroidaceae bacterium]
MLLLLSCAKTMSERSNIVLSTGTTPQFGDEASQIAFEMSQLSVNELEQALRINAKLAVQNYHRFQEFHADDKKALQALMAYTGMVFKRINPGDFTQEELLYAQDHLRLTSFCYGLLRPLDFIKPYRMEGNVKLPGLGDLSMFEYWRPRLTDIFIETIKKQGSGILLNLASDEMKQLFDWNKVAHSVEVITPDFKVWKNGKLNTIVIYTKMMRGEMTRFVLKNKIENPEELKQFSWEGFEYNEPLSNERNLLFTSAPF